MTCDSCCSKCCCCFDRIDYLRQFKALTYKNFLLKIRQPFSLLFEIALPCFIIIALAGIYSISPDSYEAASTHPGVNFTQSTLVSPLYQLMCNQRRILAFVPDNGIGRQIGDALSSKHSFLASCPNWYNTTTASPFVYFASESALNQYIGGTDYGSNDANTGLWAAVIVRRSVKGSWDYVIRLNASSSPAGSINTFTDGATNEFQLDYSGSAWNTYLNRGFMTLQTFIDNYIITQDAGVAPPSTSFEAIPFPTGNHYSSNFAQTVAGILGLLYTLMFMWPTSRIVKQIVEEKEYRIRESMRIMGLSDSVLWVSWFILYLVLFFISALIIVLITNSNIYKHSDKGIIILIYLLYGMACFSFAYLIAAFFQRSTLASIVGALLWLGIFFPYYAVSDQASSLSQKTAACLSAPACFSLGVTTIQYWESAQQGITNNNISVNYYNFNVGTAIGMLFLDIILYLCLGLYIDRVMPSSFGLHERWNFLCTKKYWVNTFSSRRAVQPAAKDSDEKVEPENAFFEQIDPEFQKRPAILLSHLRKEFEGLDGTNVVAVNDVSLRIAEGQIFALLGHNGAGKTTIINMLTGMYEPTTGDARVYGLSVQEEMHTIRGFVGYCPQHDVLFPLLTVAEHLAMFARIKGMHADEIEAAVTDMIAQVGLTEKTDARAGSLSGGQKRKLSVGIALIAGSKVVFLDEPTSGMDPYSRRSTWELLRQSKKNRLIVLTTHFMDEADQLGDRIAIMARGDVQCCGSSLFLKNRYGVGYTLTLSKQDHNANDEALRELVVQHVPNAELLSDAAGELSFRLPFNMSARFPELFEVLDLHPAQFGIQNYGISVTTLEEVFLRVGHGVETKAVQIRSGNEVSTLKSQRRSEKSEFKQPAAGNNPFVDDLKLDDSDITFKRHLTSLIQKRWINIRRDRSAALCQLLYPALVMIVGIGLLQIALQFSFPDATIDTSPYNRPNYIPYNAWSSTADNSSVDFLKTYLPTAGAQNQVPIPATNGGPSGSLVDVSSVAGMNTWMLGLLSNIKNWGYKQSMYGAFVLSNITTPNVAARIFFNTTASASLPVHVNLYNNMLYQNMTGITGARISVKLSPFQRTAAQISLTNTLAAVFITIAMAFVPASYLTFIVREREQKVRHQQLISGVNIHAYWLSNYFFDVLFFVCPATIVIIVTYMFSITELTGSNSGPVILALILFGLSMPPLTYCISFIFKSHATAQIVALLGFIMSGAILVIVDVVLVSLPSTRDTDKRLKFLYRINPIFCFGEILTNLIVRQTPLIFGTSESAWSMNISGWPMIYMTIEIFVFSLILLLIEKVMRTPNLFRWCFPDPPVVDAPYVEDEDVIQERQRIVAKKGRADGKDIMQLEGLRKVFSAPFGSGQKAKVAVKNLWFGVHPGECFGFLGINGAGKTTTLEMLSGDIIPTDGTALLDGLNILYDQKSIRRRIGYCPQFDALFDTMTAREHLFFYCRVKGVPEDIIPGYVEAMISHLGLTPFADQMSKGYSGGNKRKLSVGVALVGNPRIVFLDEPSTGMDPKSRRFMWDLISSTMVNRSVVLTTHSMEECEALCDRIGIMVGGRLRCLGTSQRLKSRFGDAFQLDFSTNGKQDAALSLFKASFPSLHVLEQHEHNTKLQIPKVIPGRGPVTLSELFRMCEMNRETLGLADYALSETTLEQIFIQFARQQEEETGSVAGLTNLHQEVQQSTAAPEEHTITISP